MLVGNAEDERALIARIAQGDQAALDQLYTAYRVRLRLYIIRRLGNHREPAEEVLQDVFLAVWTHAGSYRGEASPAAWIFRIAHHHVAKAQRRFMRRAEGHSVPLVSLHEDEAANAEVGSVVSPEDAILDRLVLQDAFARLSPKHREALELTFYHTFTLEEIAHILEIPTGTVKSRLSYARRALLQELTVTEKEEFVSHE